MGIIGWLIFGAIVGWIASKIMGTDAQQGILLNIVVGVVGALLGGWLWGLLTSDPDPYQLGSRELDHRDRRVVHSAGAGGPISAAGLA